MHHYGRRFMKVHRVDDGYVVEAMNQVSNAVVQLSLPERGLFEEEDRVLTPELAEDIAGTFVDYLAEVTGHAEPTLSW